MTANNCDRRHRGARRGWRHAGVGIAFAMLSASPAAVPLSAQSAQAEEAVTAAAVSEVAPVAAPLNEEERVTPLTAAPRSSTEPTPVVTVSASDEQATVEVALYKSKVMQLPQSAKRISVGNPGIADVINLRGNQIYIIGKALGSTNITVWDANDRIFASYDVEVTYDLETLKKKLHELLPEEKIKVTSAQQHIVLSGEASSLDKMNAVVQLAQSFLPQCVQSESQVQVSDVRYGERGGSARAAGGGGGGSEACKGGGIVNLMQVGGAQQVMLEVKVAEMARTLARRLESGFNIIRFGGHSQVGAVSGGATFPNALTPGGLLVPIFGGSLDGTARVVGPAVDKFTPNVPSIQNTGLFASTITGKYGLEAVFDVARNNNLAKVLAEPTLTTLTGQEAKFLSGGEFPIPVPQTGGTSGAITVEYKNFGVEVKFLPVVLDSGRINMKMAVAVSELSSTASIVVPVAGSTSTFVIPSLVKRSSSSTVELADGQTIGIAGLLNDNLREAVQRFPGLGDIPVLGALFRSSDYQADRTELVIFVTAHLAKPIAPTQIKLPTENFVPPGELEFYLLGRLEAGKGPTPPVRSEPLSKGGTDGAQFGHQQ